MSSEVLEGEQTGQCRVEVDCKLGTEDVRFESDWFHQNMLHVSPSWLLNLAIFLFLTPPRTSKSWCKGLCSKGWET